MQTDTHMARMSDDTPRGYLPAPVRPVQVPASNSEARKREAEKETDA